MAFRAGVDGVVAVWSCFTLHRLTFSQDKLRVYDHKEYEDAMFHFNTITRTTYFEHNVRADGIDHCFDCISELFILDVYLQEQRKVSDEKERQRQVGKLSDSLSKAISKSGRTLALSGFGSSSRH